MGGGWGHVSRSACLARELAPWPAKIFTNSPYAGSLREVEFSATLKDAGVLVVDTFPRGLGGELKDWMGSSRALKVLVHRDLNPAYVEWAGLREFVSRHYDVVFCPGEEGPLSDLPQAVKTEAWVREPVPCGDAEVVVCAGGNTEELAWYGAVTSLLARQTRVRCIAAELPLGCREDLWLRYWPAVDWMANARVVVGGAGYNTVHEARACGVPLIAKAWPRKYDRQEWRAERFNCRTVRTPEEAAEAACELIREGKRETVFPRGAATAAEWIKSKWNFPRGHA
jgi:hypothetical protein